MLEISATDSTATANIATVKRYAPPNQRNRSLGRRKSGVDRLERANSYARDGDKNQNSILRNMPSPSGAPFSVISLNGCCNSEVVQLLNDRWVTAMNLYNSLPEGSPGRPEMYTRSPSPWRLPHQMSLAVAVGPSKRDFLSELWQCMQNQNCSSK